ncbi:SGNH hydrolase-type esterase domain-containing protein [Aspergillus cavernicola]|uniref:SGNH hydrolase-type esterase domain-containing protein n=1 Tax=Aspergillus cavernicola TaxID=176166 RepID=A0ABR4J545_9EURO
MASAGEPSLYKPYDQFILFGDSITEMSSNQEMGFGLQPALQDAYSRVLDVINRGFGGYGTAHAIKVFPKFFPTPETASVRFLTIWFGANDASLLGSSQHVPLDVYKMNLARIVQHPATVAQKPRILIITPTPVNEYQLQGFDEGKGNSHPSRVNSQTRLYAEAAGEVAGSLKLPVVDLWTAFMTAAGWKEGQPLIGSREAPNNEKFASLFTDGLHLTADGYRIVYDEVVKAIQTNWPDQAPGTLPQVFPGWTEAPK